jgi:hypothetical protein
MQTTPLVIWTCGAHVTVALQVVADVVMAWPWAFKTHTILPVASAVPTAVTVRFSPPGHEADTVPVAVAVPPAGTITGVGCTLAPGMVTATLRLTALGLCRVTVAVTGTLAELPDKIRLVVPFPLTAAVELKARSQVRLIGTTVTEALAEQVDPKPEAQALSWLVAPTALVIVTVLLTVPAAVEVNEAKAVADPPAGIVLGIAGLNVNPVLSLMATLFRSS